MRPLTATPDGYAESMATLLGLSPGAIPDKTVALVAFIAEAQRRGITWAVVAPCLGARSGKEAKATAKRLARLANRKLVAEAAGRLMGDGEA